MNNLKYLIFDADDTLWENNIFYETTRENFITLCESHGIKRTAAEHHFIKTETEIVHEKGYGTSNFLIILKSLFEKLLPHNAKSEFDVILNNFEDKIYLPRSAFPGVEETLHSLKKEFSLFVLTKGDLDEQKRKLDQSGLNRFFTQRFVVPEKNIETYNNIVTDQGWQRSEVCMIGNSPKSDINPALAAGMWAIFIPYAQTWYMEDEALQENHERLIKISQFDQLENILIRKNDYSDAYK